MPSNLVSWMNSSDAKTKPKGKPTQSKRKQTSLLTHILSQIKDQPIRPSDYPSAPTSGPPGVLINIDYQGDAAVAKLKIYDVEKVQVYEWLDNTQHHPYCLTDLSRDDLS
ncbi:MAG: hypothetical protein ACXACH_02180, partial [Candidatus Hermodarchaeia archaeon]